MAIGNSYRLRGQPSRVCAGPSMMPTVSPGEPVRLREAARRGIRPGDAVLFTSPGGDYDVLHRFVFKVPFTSYFVHRGDAASASVGLARCDRIVGLADLPQRRVSWTEQLQGISLVAKRAAMRVCGTRSRKRLSSA